MLIPSDKCFKTIMAAEDCHLSAYPDPASPLATILIKRGLWAAALAGQPIPANLLNTLKGDPWTIGWGQTGPDVKYGVRWTQEEADRALAKEVDDVGVRVNQCLTREPTQDQFDAMVSFAYNTGLANFRTSTLLKKFNAGDVAGAQGEFARWIYAQGKVLNGLVKRRKWEARLFSGDPDWLR